MSAYTRVDYPTLDWRAVGPALAVFLAFTYILCVIFDLLVPGLAMYKSWMTLLPGFTWLSWGSLFLGLVESLAYGFYFALVFCPLFNLFSRVFGRS